MILGILVAVFVIVALGLYILKPKAPKPSTTPMLGQKQGEEQPFPAKEQLIALC